MRTNPKNEPMLTAAELVARLQNTPERRIGRMTYVEQKGLLGRVVLGDAKVTEEEGSALLDALRLQPQDVSKAIEHVENMRRRNAEGRENWLRLQEIEAAMREPLAALTEKAIELFGDYETTRPCVFEVDYQRDLCEASSPALVPFAEAVTVAMAGYAEAARFAQRFEEIVNTGDLSGLADRRRELAADAARRAAS